MPSRSWRERAAAGDRLAVVTNGGGFGVLATDAVVDEGAASQLAPETLAASMRCCRRPGAGAIPSTSSATPRARYADALSILFEDHGVDAILALNTCPTAITSSVEAARAVSETMRTKRRIPLVAGWVGDSAMAVEARRTLEAARLPVYETPEEAVSVIPGPLPAEQEALLETPSVPEDFAPTWRVARQVIAAALGSGREWLTEPEAVGPRRLSNPGRGDARRVDGGGRRGSGSSGRLSGGAEDLSPDITHSRMSVASPSTWRTKPTSRPPASGCSLASGHSAGGADRRFRRAEDGAAAGAHELIVGACLDAQFGPVVLFGQGGTAAEVIADRALALPPLCALAHDLMAQTRIHRLLCGYRDRPAADLDAVALVLLKVAQLVADLAEVTELDINPLADRHGVVALDARIRVAQTGKRGGSASLFAHT